MSASGFGVLLFLAFIFEHPIIFIAIVLFPIIYVIVSVVANSSSKPDYHDVSYISKPSFSSNSSVTLGDGDGRHLFGKRLSTQEDWDRWWVLRGKGEGYEGRLYVLETLIEAEDTENAADYLAEWKERYSSYRSLCVNTGMWNSLLEDREPFIPTQYQLQLEKRLYNRIDRKFFNGEEKRRLYAVERKENAVYEQSILDYLLSMPYHRAVRSEMLNQLSQNDNDKKRRLSKVYKSMVKRHILLERAGENGRYIVRKAPVRKQKNATIPVLKESVYDPSLYSHVDKRTEYKVEYTVSSPQNLDREKNTCEYVSATRGDRYWTSLSECTCPVFDKKHPCKHMVALASYLGYYNMRK